MVCSTKRCQWKPSQLQDISPSTAFKPSIDNASRPVSPRNLRILLPRTLALGTCSTFVDDDYGLGVRSFCFQDVAIERVRLDAKPCHLPQCPRQHHQLRKLSMTLVTHPRYSRQELASCSLCLEDSKPPLHQVNDPTP